MKLYTILLAATVAACASDGRYVPMASPAGFGAGSKMPGVVATAGHVWQAGAQITHKSDRYDMGFYKGAQGGAEWCEPVSGSQVTVYGTRPPGVAVKASGTIVETGVWFNRDGHKNRMIAIRPNDASVKLSAAGYSGGPVVDEDGCTVAMSAMQIQGFSEAKSEEDVMGWLGQAQVKDILAYPKSEVYAEAKRLGVID